MALTSVVYLGFLAICVCIYRIAPEKWHKYLLLLFSVGFYCYAMPRQLLIMMVYIWCIFLLGLIIGSDKNHKKIWPVTGILLSVGFLFVYKYLNFSISLFGGARDTFSLIVPIGISYVTFQCIAYLVEIAKGNMPVCRDAVAFFNYCLFFAKITAGPIEPPAKFLANPEISGSTQEDGDKKQNEIRTNDYLSAFSMIAVGMLKKIAVADLLGVAVATVYDSPETANGLSVVIASCMYAAQILFDFSGYTDIARGSARFFGIELTENFKHPYGATSVAIFWRRWHISLSEWLKTYIYIPLGGSRVETLRRYFNVMVTFLVSGIWHGASLNYIVWGALHGLYQVVELATKPVMTRLKASIHLSDESILCKSIAIAKTFILVSFAWIFFRAASLKEALVVIGHIFTKWDFSVLKAPCGMEYPALIFVIIAGLFSSVFVEKNRRPFVNAVIAIWLISISFLFMSVSATSNFIYFNF